MRVSGFTIVRDGVKLGYPFQESICSILDLVDEFVVAVGDSSDDTLAQIRAIDSPKMRVFESPWDPAMQLGGEVFAHQTNRALARCTGDWCFYLQADEVIHEDDLPAIEASMRYWLPHRKVLGLSFRYLHFMGDYDICNPIGYRRQVRIVRNGAGVKSIGDACGFACGDRKLKRFPAVRRSGGRVFHYGWARPPKEMGKKLRQFRRFYRAGRGWDNRGRELPPVDEAPEHQFDLSACVPCHVQHPAVMLPRIALKDWERPDFHGRPAWRNAAFWDRQFRKQCSWVYRLVHPGSL